MFQGTGGAGVAFLQLLVSEPADEGGDAGGTEASPNTVAGRAVSVYQLQQQAERVHRHASTQ